MTTYVPERYAFRFPNSFVNQVWTGRIPPLIGRTYEIKTSGRCGGMAFASLDFFHLGIPVPFVEPDDFSSADVPPDGDPVGDYIFKRQLHSMLTSRHGIHNGVRFLHWSGLTAERILQQSLAEERKALESLDRGEPVILGLIQATRRGLTAQGVNHQVVGYGYRTNDAGRPEFLVYDPNEPFRPASKKPYEVILRRAEDHDPEGFAYQLVRPHRIDRWRGFFVQQYRPYTPSSRVVAAHGD
ncbi:hypothetical protein GCM10023190_13360 [Enteractinococcus fodinae]|uniref:Peptidase C39-like domain-containing protein n=1 Tax=Enteractinococcus fodinae TaxID=684663 RepID=A0ABU2B067_9MICC|nr:hypothetical protein [Enteractinococcus fodinae]MDR7346188.1 hypothetical protein [Enteractinococcus fodinae]